LREQDAVTRLVLQHHSSDQQDRGSEHHTCKDMREENNSRSKKSRKREREREPEPEREGKKVQSAQANKGTRAQCYEGTTN
jgi:hypothetical protein